MAKHALIATGIFSATWWKATGWRVLYTVLAVLVPFAIQLTTGDVSILYVASVAGFAAILSFITALARLPETADANVPVWRAILWRLVRQAGQTLGAALAAYTLIEEVPWADTFRALAGVLLLTLLRTLIDTLPEAARPAGDGDEPV